MALNKQQIDVVRNSYDKDTVLVAGAGSGKTTVLTNRVAHIINEELAKPYEIMCITFTVKAANEMRKRITRAVDDIKGLTCGTFHGVFLHILKKYIEVFDKKNVNVINTSDKRSLIIECLKKLNIGFSSEDISELDAGISQLKNNIVSPVEFEQEASTHDDKKLSAVYMLYNNTCWEQELFDFDDILVYTWVLLEQSKEVREIIKNKYKFIMVDEAQDCNKLQINIIKLLNDINNNIMLIGDYSQSIYSFRNAKPEYMINYSDTLPGSKVMKLERNYRSTQTIVNASNSLISHNEEKLKYKAFSQNEVGELINVVKFDNSEDEAEYVACEIDRLIRSNKNVYSDFYVLYRNSYLSREIEEKLRDFRIPYIIKKGTNFWEREEILNLIAYYRLLKNNNDEIAFRRLSKSIEGIGTTAVNNIIDYARANNKTLVELFPIAKAKKTGRLVPGLLKLYDIVTMPIDVGLDVIARKIVDNMGIIEKYERMKDKEKSQDKITNVQEFVTLSVKYKNLSLDEFLDEVALSNISKDEKQSTNVVQLMTIHSSKGLESDKVFIIGMEEGIMPSALADDVSEERRIAYVACTRAKSKLYITHCKERIIRGKTMSRTQSKFIKELDEKHLKKFKY